LTRDKDILTLPIFWVSFLCNFIYLRNFTLNTQYTAADTNLISSGAFVTGQDPDFAATFLKVNDAFSDIVLEQILNTSDTKHCHINLNLLHCQVLNLIFGHGWHFFVSIDKSSETLFCEIV